MVSGDYVAVGFSGGADSCLLLTVLCDFKALLKIELLAVHVNHGLRGQEARRDAEFCREYAASLNIPFELVLVDTPGLVAARGMSEEEAARLLRYEAIGKIANKAFGKNYKIAVAHQADDQAETILFNLSRGSGLSGAKGMRPKRENIIRPLLSISRNDILLWLNKRGLSFVTDSTNLENDHARNALRNVIFPELCERINKEAVRHISEFGEKVLEADDFIRGEALRFLREQGCTAQKGSGETIIMKLSKQELKEKARVFRIYVIIEALKLIGTPMKDLSRRHFDEIDALLFMGKGAHADLKETLSAENIYHETLLRRKVGA